MDHARRVPRRWSGVTGSSGAIGGGIGPGMKPVPTLDR
jgi:hypothetical protein